MNTPITDSELIALAALANIEAVMMAGDNVVSAHNGELPAWRSGTGYMQYTNELEMALMERMLRK